MGYLPKLRPLLAACAAAGLLGAAPAQALGLLDAYQAALRNDPVFQAALQDAAAGAENRILGRSALLPNISGQFSTSRNRADTVQTIGSREILNHPRYTSKVEVVQLRQPLFNVEAYARYKQGIAQSQYAEAALSAQSQELVLRLSAAYFDALLAADQLQLATAQRDVLAEQRKVNDRLFTGGEGTRTDMLETQARLDVAEAQVVEAQSALVTSRNTLAAMVGSEIDSLAVLNAGFRPGPLSPQDFASWKSRALEQNPEIQAQQYAAEVARQEITKARAGHMPRIDFVASYSKNDSETINTYDQNSTVRSIGVQMTVPLYAGGSVSAVSRQAVAGHEKARAQLQSATDKVLIEVRKQYDVVQSSTAKVAALEKAVESGRLLVEATTQSIKGGVRINLDLLNAQQQLYTSLRDLAQARYSYLLGTLRLKAAAGGLDVEDVRLVAAYFR